ncbi:protein CURVATURE THYLAKOID 1C-like isoform X1 [Glycine max]|uniref:protein CURVATURE THYLAKOID 1C-like isoform X1 n=1 Tax=Glycine max TaxID=3847 RepID=UPI0003DE74E8|nr:protein CURVATURE THYLAKOID 1C-like isoform X1 [Glycine max]
MASIVASLPPPLLLPARKYHPGNFPSSPFSLLSGRRNHVSFVVKASGESSESSTTLTVFKSVQNVWDQPEDRLGLIGLGFAAIAAFWASTNLIAAIDKLPVFPTVLELIGIFYSVVSAVLHNWCVFLLMPIMFLLTFPFNFSGLLIAISYSNLTGKSFFKS